MFVQDKPDFSGRLKVFVGRETTAIEAARADRGLLMEGLGNNCHPTEAVEMSKRLAWWFQTCPNLRISATTHSPFVLDGFETTVVMVCARGVDGKVVSKPLSSADGHDRWNKSLSSGEMWSVLGEDWVLK